MTLTKYGLFKVQILFLYSNKLINRYKRNVLVLYSVLD